MKPLTGESLGRLLRERGKARELGGFILTYARTGSTNDVALRLARQGLPHGSLILAEEQTAGRGRWERRWISPPGVGVYLSALLRPCSDALSFRPPGRTLWSSGGTGVSTASPGPLSNPSPASLLPLMVSVAVAEAVGELSGAEARIRWPNDLRLNGRKLAGILCEASFAGEGLEFAVAGIGVNVNQQSVHFPCELAGTATSLLLATGRTHDRLELAAGLAEKIEFWWEGLLGGRFSSILARWRELGEGEEGMKVRVSVNGKEFQAVTAGLAADGGLMVRRDDGRLEILHSAEVYSLQEAG